MTGARVLVYSHDTYGLGHLRRCLAVTERIAALPEIGSVLLATGSPRAEAFDLPGGCDRLALPALTKDPRGGYRPRSIGLPLQDLMAVRAEVLRSAAMAFRPDVLLVDHAPVGAMGELRPALEALGRMAPRPSFVLGLRDIIDSPERVRSEWDGLGAWEVVDGVYDRILVYGDPALRSTAQELGLPFRRPGVVHTGYVAREVRAHRRSDLPVFVVTAGGGGDGQVLLRAYGDFLEDVGPAASFRSVVVTGPLMSGRRRTEIRQRLGRMSDRIEVLEFTKGLEELMAEASGVISMAGYNSVAEILSAGVPALVAPREGPRQEQLIRAERLGALAGLQWTPLTSLDSARIRRFVEGVMAGEVSPPRRIRLDGAERAAAEIAALLRGEAATDQEPAHVGEVVGLVS